MESDIKNFRVSKFYKTEDKQYAFLRRLALTFRAQTPLLSDIFQIPEDELYQKIINYNYIYDLSLKFLFNFDISDQEEARNNLIVYLNELLEAARSKNVESQKRLLAIISDSHMKEIIQKSKTDGLNSDEMLKVLEYQIKYALSMRKTAALINLHPATYSDCIQKFLDNDETLREGYDKVSDFQLSRLEYARRGK